MKQEHRNIMLFVTVFVLALLISVSCAPKATPASPTPTTAPVARTSTPESGGTASAPGKVIELKFSTFQSPQHYIVKNVHNRWAQEVEARTKGRVKVTMYYAESLGKAAVHYEMLSTGIAEAGLFLPSYTQGRFPLTGIVEIPFYGDAVKATRSITDLFNMHLYREYPEIKMLYIVAPPIDIGVKKPVKTMEELKGLKIRTTGGYVTKTLEALGATPVTMPVTEIYTSMERGVVDGFTINYNSWPGYKLQEVSKNVIVAGFSTPLNIQGMNINTWKSLPPDIQKIIDGVNTDATQWWLDATAAENTNAVDIMQKAGVNIYYLPDAERARWKEKVKPLWDEWEKDVNAKGLSGTKVRADFEVILKKYGVQ